MPQSRASISEIHAPAPAPTADTAELGIVARHPALETRVAAFRTRVANEVLFDPEAARFVATGETIRRGLVNAQRNGAQLVYSNT